MNSENKKRLDAKSLWLRQQIYKMVLKAKKGHIPSSFSMAELLTCLFYDGFIDQENFKKQNEQRDKLIISKGHAAKAVYPILNEFGMVSDHDIDSFITKDCKLRMYADNSIPGVETVTGSLGHGYGIAAGLAFSQKKQGIESKIFAVIGDGECYEGSVWETAMFITTHNLDNLITIIDRNKLCILGETEKLLKLDPLDKKWEAFGFNVYDIDGHSHEEISSALADSASGPKAIILNTVKGKGISFMEGQNLWHNRMPNKEEQRICEKELGLLSE